MEEEGSIAARGQAVVNGHQTYCSASATPHSGGTGHAGADVRHNEPSGCSPPGPGSRCRSGWLAALVAVKAAHDFLQLLGGSSRRGGVEHPVAIGANHGEVCDRTDQAGVRALNQLAHRRQVMRLDVARSTGSVPFREVETANFAPSPVLPFRRPSKSAVALGTPVPSIALALLT